MNVLRGKDDTLFATADGIVRFRKRTVGQFNGRRVLRSIVSVEPTPV